MLKSLGFAALAGWIAAALLPLVAHAGEISSVYTPLKLDACKLLKEGGEEAQGGTWRCKGYNGMDVLVSEGDARMFVAFGPNAEKQKVWGQTIPMFNMIGETLEWRARQEGGGWKPFATILRYNWSVDDRKGATLVITKLDKTNACHLAYVDAAGNPQANEQARVIADRDAGGFDCKRDTPKLYAINGSLMKD